MKIIRNHSVLFWRIRYQRICSVMTAWILNLHHASHKVACTTTDSHFQLSTCVAHHGLHDFSTNVTTSKLGRTLCRRKKEVHIAVVLHSLLGPNNHQSQLFQLSFKSFCYEAHNTKATIMTHLLVVQENSFTTEFHNCALK